MTYCALAAHLCFMQTIVLSPYMTTFMALAKDYGHRVTKCVLTATRTSELYASKTGTGFSNIWPNQGYKTAQNYEHIFRK